MKIYCNYSKSDWSRFLFALNINLLVYVMPLVFYVVIVFVPSLPDLTHIYLTSWKESKVLELYLQKSWESFDNSTGDMGTKINAQFMVGFGSILGPLIISIIPLYYGVRYLPTLADYIIKKTKYGPRMNLVIKRVKPKP